MMPAAARHLTHFVVVGAGAAGLMTARELARAGKRVTVLEAKDRCGGRIYPLPAQEFGYPAEGGAEFVHGAAPVTRALMREAGVSLSPRGGTRWSTRTGALLRDESSLPHAGRFYRALAEVKGRDAKGCVEIVDPPFESEVRFAGDSPVEGVGFEPSVPR